MRVSLTAEDVADARVLAERTYEVFRTTRGYYRNTPSSHLIGKLGEIATEAFLEGKGLAVEPKFRDAGMEARADIDILDPLVRVEVKTWDAMWWSFWGRCVATGQIGDLLRKADLVIWVTIAEPGSDKPVPRVMGWSTVDEVASAEVRWTGPKGRQVQNHQLDPDDLRAPEGLAGYLGSLS